jgi:2-iminobutanoate/2-iminopropanoate deaminase
MLQVIHSDNAPKAVGPYSQAIKAGDFIFCSGQIPLDPATSKLIEGDIKAQTYQVLKNVQEVLKACNCSLENVVKAEIFLADINDFAFVNEVYQEFFTNHKPARNTYQVAALPLGAKIEISVLAFSKN